MYTNVGKKIMVLAQVCGWICLIAGTIAWMGLVASEDYFIAAWISLAAGAVGFIFSWPLYGFGQLVDDVRAMKPDSAAPVETAPVDEQPEPKETL